MNSVQTILILVLLIGAGVEVVAGQEDDGSKGIKAEVFISRRPVKSSTKPATTARYKSPARPIAALESAPPAGMIFAQLGVTTWRFRPATSLDNTKELIEEGGESSQWTLERVAEGTPFSPGQRVRLSIESLSRDGYLYVINREEFADGTLGDARLIFPTKRTEPAGNLVKAGRLIYIPAPPRYFRIKPSDQSKVQTAEVLLILVSPQPLINANELSTNAITLPGEKVTAWQKQWEVTATKFEMAGGVGQTMTEREQAAANDSMELTQNDPAPQTIYRVALKPENPLLVTVRLRFGSPD